MMSKDMHLLPFKLFGTNSLICHKIWCNVDMIQETCINIYGDGP